MKPWITREIFKSIKTKIILTYFIHGNSNEKQIFKKYANQLKRINVASKNYFIKALLKNLNAIHSSCGAQLNLCCLLPVALPFLKHLNWMVPSPQIQYSWLKDSTINLL